MRKFIPAAFTAALLLCSACTSNKNPDTQKALSGEQNQAVRFVKAEPEDLQPVINSYSELTHALSENDGKSAADAGSRLIVPLQKLLEKTVPEMKQQEFKAIIADALENAEHIRDNAAHVHHQREHLDFLSRDLADLTAITGSPQVLYKIECSRAGNNNGAFWLSTRKTDRNPYLGEDITDCGEVTAELGSTR